MKIVLCLLAFVIVGCSSSNQEDIKHFHGKNIHELKKMPPPSPPPASGTVTHFHGKNTHELKKAP